MSKLKEGTYVLIDKNCPKTKANYGYNENMEKMMGKIHEIKKRNCINSVFIKGWIWHIDDLKPFSIKKKKIPPELFDINNLNS